MHYETPLKLVEEQLGANFGEFAGWEMPMSYGNYKQEHMAVRTSAAFFDLSHMGRLKITGDPKEFDGLTTRGISKFREGEMTGPQAFLNDRGGFVDDFMGYRLGEREFLIVTNAVNREKVVSWVHKNSSLEVEDLTFKYAMLAIQGREVWKFVTKPDLEPLKFVTNVEFLGVKVYLLSRSGWTGEDGVEVWAEPTEAEKLVKKLVELGVKPAGLITRDSIRQEVGFVLYGEDIDENTTPVEARYWIFDLDREYVGHEAIKEQIRSGVSRLRVGFKAKKGENRLPRHGHALLVGGVKAGNVTSSTFSPYLNRVIGMGYVRSDHFYLGLNFEAETRSGTITVKLSDFPLL
ncbi:MAG: glycine cleavage system aminomethyltransferase GcvT [Thermoprotei archaeon]